ncbi:hypothetical protein SLE2022_120320 [Rubroshorea leprosula]
MKRKSEFQVQALQKFYAEGENPTHKKIEDYAAALGLTYEQVRKWFSDKRRRKKKGGGAENLKQRDPLICNRTKTSGGEERKSRLIQDLMTPGYILAKVFRKDGPTLGAEFDSPLQQFRQCSKNSYSDEQECRRGASKKRKVSELATMVYQNNNKESAPVTKHGMGKGLMTVWRVVNPQGGNLPPGIESSDGQIDDLPQISTLALQKPLPLFKKQQPVVSLLKKKRLEKELQEKKRRSVRRREVESNRDDSHKQPCKEKCELALEAISSSECLDQLAMLVDDEELELRELQVGSNPQKCSDHLGTGGVFGCSLCRDLLPKFPPNSVKMKLPFGMQPWDSCPETVKKLFKVFHFLYTYSVKMDICPFTLDEFAQAFHDKDSLLLGKIHVSLLKLLLFDVEMELSTGVLPHLSVSCKFLALLHSVENQKFVVEFWRKSLNPLTWVEILRQVLIAAGFGSKQGALRREALSKEMSLMVKYGLCPDTLKGELFRLLSEQGNRGMKVSALAKSSPITKLNLDNTAEELEQLICSTLSSDITLFEKISLAAYRLRAVSIAKEADDFQSDSEDSGSIDDDSGQSVACSSSDDSDFDSENSCQQNVKHNNCYKCRKSMLTVNNEIDESNPGEVWLLGLMEGEYSDLSIEEKLNALVALTDLLSASSSIRTENPTKTVVEWVPNIYSHGSGAKIKRASLNQQKFSRPSWLHVGQKNGFQACTSPESCPVDSSLTLSKFYEMEKSSSNRDDARETKAGVDLHPMQSIFLGADRRYNRYWLFLGPCNECDPGHRRIYFESSEDGHWQVIDSEEALRALLSILDDRGRREALLIESLEKREAPLCQAMLSRLSNNVESMHTHSDSSELDIVREDSSSPVSGIDNSITQGVNDASAQCGAIVLEAGKKGEEQKRKWRCLHEYDGWIWDYFYLNLNAVKLGKRSYVDSLTRCERCHDLYWRDEKHCKICHTTFELDFDLEERYAVHAATCREKENDIFPHKVLSSQLQSLKAAVHAIESIMPEEALVGAWTKSAHRLWVRRLRRTSSLSELLQVLADFVAAINEDWLNHYIVEEGSFTVIEEIVVCFPTMPQTSSAIALWLVKLDALIAPYLEKVNTRKKQAIRSGCSGKRSSTQIESLAEDHAGGNLICL